MTEKEVEKAYKKMTESDAPDLWAKIESNLPEKEVRTEKKVDLGKPVRPALPQGLPF